MANVRYVPQPPSLVKMNSDKGKPPMPDLPSGWTYVELQDRHARIYGPTKREAKQRAEDAARRDPFGRNCPPLNINKSRDHDNGK